MRSDPLTAQVGVLVELYEEFLREPVADPDVRLEQARAWHRVGFLYAEPDRPATRTGPTGRPGRRSTTCSPPGRVTPGAGTRRRSAGASTPCT